VGASLGFAIPDEYPRNRKEADVSL
jgi:hypothetical protein